MVLVSGVGLGKGAHHTPWTIQRRNNLSVCLCPLL